MQTAQALLAHCREMPLVAILRGLDTNSAASIGLALVDSGFRILEVPLNRPGAIECIAILARTLPADVVVGGGTLLTPSDVRAVHEAGGQLMVAPNCNTVVISDAVACGMLCVPGIATPSEAFAALQAGAHALKVFPAEMVGGAGLKAMKSVLPPGTELWPVGGITPDNMRTWLSSGATGFGIGSSLYLPGDRAGEVLKKARLFVQTWKECMAD